MTTTDIPRTPNDLTAKWLNTVLSNHLTDDTTILSFDTEIIGAGLGVLGELLRITLHYNHATNAPKSLVAKFASPNPEAREICRTFSLYENEVHFYQELANDTPMQTPVCHIAYNDPETQDTLILLEDLSSATMADQVKGCSSDQAAVAIRELANLHAHWWNHPKLNTLSWIHQLDDPIYTDGVPAMYRTNAPITLEHLGDHVPSWYPPLHDGIENKMADLLRQFAQLPTTLCHGDYRLDNQMFHSQNGQLNLTAIDWQVVLRGPGVFDLGYFMSQSLTVEDRRAHEKDLLTDYYNRLIQQNVPNITFEQIYETYRKVCLYCLCYLMIAGAALDLSSPRSLQLLHAGASRAWSAIEDLNSIEFLS